MYEMVLYLLDFGDFVKIGTTKSLRERMNQINKVSEKPMILDRSLIFKVSYPEGNHLEGSIKKKYSKFIVESAICKTEVFAIESKEPILSDLLSVINIFEIDYKVYRVSDLLEYREGSKERSLFFTPDTQKIIDYKPELKSSITIQSVKSEVVDK